MTDVSTPAQAPDATAALATRVVELAGTAHDLLDEMERAVVGKRDVLEVLLAAVLAGGHVVIEDVPGVAKTLIARSFAAVTGLTFSRIQFTPDLVPGDVTGSALPDRSGVLAFQPGPLFANLVLGDEINRAPPKTQAAVLEAMAERQVTVDGVSHPLPDPFVFLATQNPIESEGTYPLPEAQLDRFMARLAVGYPDPVAERELVARRIERGTDEVDLRPVLDAARLLALRDIVEAVPVAADVVDHAVRVVEHTRDHPSLEVGASPRATLALVRMARALAAVRGRPFVVPDDVKQVAAVVLAHRLVLHPDAWVRGVTTRDVVADALGAVPVPAPLNADDRSRR